MASTSTSSTEGRREAEYEISDDHRGAWECHERTVQELLQRRRAYAMVVPTNGLFDEREMERRDRLRALMVRLKADGQVNHLLRA
ncbi:unnamed protein product [Miscanthus lutarioriparius]|uniref:Uncharacterized protein n=1 Tax=Miscanthus lutarioriparius TaxID=422564 RepID=A0A811RXC3_9POAL|nr:unnamed protein product [Miscanthus lutarioriparius]